MQIYYHNYMKKEEIIRRVAENIRVERARRKFNQEKLAELSGISTKYVNSIENQKVNPSIAVAYNICEALGIDLNKLIS